MKNWRGCLALEEYSGFGGLAWSRFIETDYKEEVDCSIEVSLIAVGAGAVKLSGVKEKYPEVFLEVWRDRQSFVEVDQSSVYKVECRCALTVRKRMKW